MTERRHQISISAAPERVFAALATSDGLSGWWTADSMPDAKVGGKAEFGFNKRQVVFHMTIEELVPPQGASCGVATVTTRNGSARR